MAEECCTPGGNIMILACSGGSNVGQLSNQAAIELTQEGFGEKTKIRDLSSTFDRFVFIHTNFRGCSGR